MREPGQKCRCHIAGKEVCPHILLSSDMHCTQPKIKVRLEKCQAAQHVAGERILRMQEIDLRYYR